MDLFAGSILAPYVALAAMLLGISLLVQVLQELWKFATSSKAVAFEKALDDFVGMWAAAHLRQDTSMAVRGPLQFRRVSKAGHVLPTAKGDLVAALEQASPAWHRLIDQALQFESLLQRGASALPSPQLLELLGSLKSEITSVRPTTQALEMDDFLTTWGVGPTGVVDAEKVRVALRHRFFAHLAPIELHYDRLMQNFQVHVRAAQPASDVYLGVGARAAVQPSTRWHLPACRRVAARRRANALGAGHRRCMPNTRSSRRSAARGEVPPIRICRRSRRVSSDYAPLPMRRFRFRQDDRSTLTRGRCWASSG